MGEPKFRIGEAVVLIKNKYWNNSGRMDHWEGKTHIIESFRLYHPTGEYQYKFKDGGPYNDENVSDPKIINSWVWLESMMRSVDNKPILKLKVKI